MDEPCASADGPAPVTPPATLRRWPWHLAWLALLGRQFWLTLTLFGPDPFARIADGNFIANGAHPQHLYLATIGIQGFLERGSTTVLDPSFQAVFLKTPIFNGSRLAEVFLLC